MKDMCTHSGDCIGKPHKRTTLEEYGYEVELEPGEPNRKANNDKISEIVRRHTQANEGVPSGLWRSMMVKELQDHMDSVLEAAIAYADKESE